MGVQALFPGAVEQAATALDALLDHVVCRLERQVFGAHGTAPGMVIPDLSTLPLGQVVAPGDQENDWRTLLGAAGFRAARMTPDRAQGLDPTTLNHAAGLAPAPAPLRAAVVPPWAVWPLVLAGTAGRAASADRAMRLTRWLHGRVLAQGDLPLLDPVQPATLCVLAMIALADLSDRPGAPTLEHYLREQFAEEGGALYMAFTDQFLCCEAARVFDVPVASTHPLQQMSVAGCARYAFGPDAPDPASIPPAFRPLLLTAERAET